MVLQTAMVVANCGHSDTGLERCLQSTALAPKRGSGWDVNLGVGYLLIGTLLGTLVQASTVGESIMVFGGWLPVFHHQLLIFFGEVVKELFIVVLLQDGILELSLQSLHFDLCFVQGLLLSDSKRPLSFPILVFASLPELVRIWVPAWVILASFLRLAVEM